MKKKTSYNTALYLRLSKGDGDVDGIEKAESNSISNQRLITEHFLAEHTELIAIDTYIDDGYTGTNFNRPELKRLLFDIEEGRIDCVVVKDLSRFGRERIATGQYIKSFKERGIRFIAINDHYDSLTSDGNEEHLIMPIKALTNDNFSRDISMKVRSSFSVKRQRGDYIGAMCPLGYKKNPENVNHLIVDEPAAKIIRQIFAMKIEGMAANQIADELTKAGILTPADYKRKHDIIHKNKRKLARAKWNATQVIRILKNEVYIGNTVQGKMTKVSYKVNKIVNNPREEWDIVESTHEPIVSSGDFQIVQSLLERDVIKIADKENPNIFSGLIFCGDCGSSMIRRKRPNKNDTYYVYYCSGYTKKGQCNCHSIKEEELKLVVKNSLNTMIRQLCQANQLARNLDKLHISPENAISRDMEIRSLREEMEKYHRLKSALYQDLKEGLISEAQCEKYREQYTNQEIVLQKAIEEQKKLIEKIYKNGIAAEELILQFKNRPYVDALNHRLLVSLIDRILVYGDNRIEIVYRYTNEIKKCQDIIENTKEKSHGQEQK